MAGIKLFRTAMNGFNKTDVLAYIDEINTTMREMESKLKKRISELENSQSMVSELEVSELKNTVEEQQDKILSLEQEREELLSRFDTANAASGELGSLRNEYEEKIKSIIDDYENKLSELNDFYKNRSVGNPSTEPDADIAVKDSEIAALTERLNDANQMSEFMENRVNTLEQKLSLVQDEADRLAAEKAALEEKLQKAEIQTDSGISNQKVTELQNRIYELESRLSSEKHKFFLINDKARLYDEIKSNVARIMNDAYRDSERITKEAQDKAEKLRFAVNENIIEARERLKIMHENVNGASKRLADAAMQMTDTFDMLIDSIELTDNQLINLIADKGSSYSIETNYYDSYKDISKPAFEETENIDPEG